MRLKPTALILASSFALAVGCGGDASEAGGDPADTSPGADVATDAGRDATETDGAVDDAGVDGDPSDDGGDDGGDDAGADTGGDVAVDADVRVDDVPLIGEVLDCGRPARAGGLADGTELRRVNLDLATYPDALCNDGTPGFFYLREAATEAGRAHWVVQLQGGSGCRDAASCFQRWCRVDTPFGMTQMSADLSPADAIDGQGILARRADNPLGDANQVFVRYCSSDLWQGERSDVVLTGPHPETAETTTARVHFRGASIVDAVFETLIDEHGLADARSLILAGASAGGAGVVTHAEGVADRLEAVDPDIDFVVLHDSHLGPALASLDYGETPLCSEQGLCDWESHFRWEVEAGPAHLRGARLDASCLAIHDEDAWKCADSGHVLRHHLTEPLMVRASQRDTLLSGNTIEGRWGRDGELLTPETYAATVRDEAADLARANETAEEGAAYERAPALFVPTCPKHETLSSNADTYQVCIDVDGTEVSMLDVLMAWRQGGGPRIAISDSPDDETCP